MITDKRCLCIEKAFVGFFETSAMQIAFLSGISAKELFNYDYNNSIT